MCHFFIIYWSLGSIFFYYLKNTNSELCHFSINANISAYFTSNRYLFAISTIVEIPKVISRYLRNFYLTFHTAISRKVRSTSLSIALGTSLIRTAMQPVPTGKKINLWTKSISSTGRTALKVILNYPPVCFTRGRMAIRELQPSKL